MMLGESPLWVVQEQALWWLDIERPRIWRWTWPDGPTEQWKPPLKITAIARRHTGGFIAASERGFALFDSPQGPYHLIANPESGLWRNRFNDGAVDPYGCFWAGSMDMDETHAHGHLYRLSADLRWARMDSGYKISNGPAFSPDGRLLYNNDSANHISYVYDLGEDGALRNKRIFLQHRAEEGAPDGMAVDVTGALWIAFWQGSCVRRYSPKAVLLQEIALPVVRPTSLCFGGPARDWLFITSAQEQAQEPKCYAGALLAMHVGVQGLASTAFAG